MSLFCTIAHLLRNCKLFRPCYIDYMSDRKLKALTKSLGAEYVRFDPFSGIGRFLNPQLWHFRHEVFKRLSRTRSLRRKIQDIYRTADNSNDAIAKVYDAEYGGGGDSN